MEAAQETKGTYLEMFSKGEHGNLTRRKTAFDFVSKLFKNLGTYRGKNGVDHGQILDGYEILINVI